MKKLKKMTQLITDTVCAIYLFGGSPSQEVRTSVKASVFREVQANLKKDAQHTILDFMNCINDDINNSELGFTGMFAEDVKNNLVAIRDMYFDMFGKEAVA